ncbi:MAG: VIT and VWA domain-containing protein [Rhodothermales bacterium]
MRLLPFVLLSLLSLPATAQIIVPPRPVPVTDRPVEMASLEIDGRIVDQVAEVTVRQTLFNPNERPVETEFLFPIPPDAAVQDLVLLVDGQELTGEVLPKDEARRRYEEIVRRMIDPALMEYAGYGLYRTSVFPVPARGESTVVFRYTEVAARDGDRVTFSYPFGLARQQDAVGRLRIGLTITGEAGAVYSPSHDVEIERERGRTRVRFNADDVRLERDFRLIYEPASDGPVSATLLSHWPRGAQDGYFLLLASPEVREVAEQALPKTVVFVIDRSGSMAGRKMEQAKDALSFVLDNLGDDDLFNVVAYDDRVETFEPELQRYSPETRRAALDYVDGLRPGGSTNIDGALTEALGLLGDDGRPAYVLFLTDGLPTAGEQGEGAIAANADRANGAHARIFSFGVGYDVNARLLERLAATSGGTTEYVRPEDDLEASVAALYTRLTSPVLSGLEIAFDGTRVNRAYPRALPDLFEGSQVVWAGRYTRGGDVTVRLTGRAGDDTHTMTFRADLAAEGDRARHSFIEPLWASRRVADLLEQIDLNGQNEELVDELVALSTRYGILTPYTSFLAEEEGAFAAGNVQVQRAQDDLMQLESVSGADGVGQRSMRADLAAKAQAPSSTVFYGADGGRREVSTVQTVGTRAFYQRGTLWIDAGLLETEPGDAREIEQFSDAYFELARQLPEESVVYLTFDEDVLVELDGEAFLIRAVRS